MSEKNVHLAALPGYGLLAVALTVLFTFTPARKEGDKKAEAEPDQATTVQPAEASVPHYLRFSWDVLGRVGVDIPIAQALVPGHLRFLEQKGLLEKVKPLKVASGTSFFILTLPDPIESQQGYWHDQSLDALSRAMSDYEYALTDRWFPWTVAAEDKSRSLLKRTGDPQREPGILVFAYNKDAENRIVVLVVGENSVTGLRVEALQAALDLAVLSPFPNLFPATNADVWTARTDVWTAAVPCQAATPWVLAVHSARLSTGVRLVGPFYTGSQASLARAILDWPRRLEKKQLFAPHVTCITGTATGLRLWDRILPDQANWLNEITGTQLPFDQLRLASLHYLSRPGRTTPTDPLSGYPEGKVAYLLEANSKFGEAAYSTVYNEPALIFRFPMHIGRLTGIHSKEARERDERLGLIRPGERQLVALDQTRSGGDLIPAADETRTALINQRLLADHWSTMRRERVRYVYVVATDTRDILYLLEQLQTACPDAQPVVFQADLHYAHPDYLRFTRGVLIVGNYPLYQPAQRWQVYKPAQQSQAMSIDPRRMPFPSSNAEGVYNAITATLEHSKWMVDYRPLRFHPQEDWKPPIWVTVVGGNGEFVPLAYFTNYTDQEHFLVPVPEDSGEPALPQSPFTRRFLYLVGLIALGVLLGGWHASRVHGKTEAAARNAHWPEWVPGLRAQYVLLAGLGGGFATLPLVLAFESAKLAQDGYAEYLLFGIVIVLFVLIPILSIGYVFWQMWLTPAEGEGRSSGVDLGPWQVVAFTLLAGGVVFGWVLGNHFGLPQAARTLFAERAANLYSGYSAVVPACVIALGLLGYGLLGLQRLELLTVFRVATPYPDRVNGAQGAVNEAFDRICRTVDDIERLPTLAGTFTDRDSRWTWPWWVRPTFLSMAVIVCATAAHIVGISAPREVHEGRFLSCLGILVAIVAVFLCGLFLNYDWRLVARVGPGTPRATSWLRLVPLCVACTVVIFATAVISVAAGAPQTVHDVLFSYLGILVAVVSVFLYGYLLTFVWRHEGKVPLGRPRPTGWLLLFLLGVTCAVALYRSQRIWESQAWNCLFATGFLALAFLTLVAAYRLYLLWKQVEKITRAIAILPMVGAFDRFPDKVCRVFGAYLLSHRWGRTLDLAIPVHLLGQLREALSGWRTYGDPSAEEARLLVRRPFDVSIRDDDELEGQNASDDSADRQAGRLGWLDFVRRLGTWLLGLSGDRHDHHRDEALTGQKASQLCQVARQLVNALAPGWGNRPVSEAFGTVPAEPGKEQEPAKEWRGLAEQFVAIMAVIFLAQFLMRMRYLAYMAMTTSASLLVAVTAYQFEPEQFLMYTAVSFAGAVILLFLWILVQINRNELISRVIRSTPNKFQLDAAFVQNLSVFVLPLLVLVATQLAGRMRSVVEPILGWLR
jgi:hypothetical protein